jgi:peroxiredoxin family protein
MVAHTALNLDSTTDRLEKMEREIGDLKRQVASATRENSVSIVCFSGEWDKLFAAFTIATGALAMGQEVHMFFTFWGATAIRNATGNSPRKGSLLQRMLSWFLPKRASRTPLSKMNFGGLGKVMLGHLLKEKGVDDLPTLIEEARQLGANFHCCETSLRLFGWDKHELIGDNESNWCGVSTFMSLARKSQVALFI